MRRAETDFAGQSLVKHSCAGSRRGGYRLTRDVVQWGVPEGVEFLGPKVARDKVLNDPTEVRSVIPHPVVQ